MADEGSAKENEGDKKIVHTYPLVKVCRSLLCMLYTKSHDLFDQLLEKDVQFISLSWKYCPEGTDKLLIIIKRNIFLESFRACVHRVYSSIFCIQKL